MKTLLPALALMLGAAAAVSAQEQPDIKPHFEKLAAAYFDLPGQYPSVYTCEMKSPEMVDSMDARGKRAWGRGHVQISKTVKGVKLTAEDIADERAKGLFDLFLGFWQIRLGLEMAALQARMPPALAGTALFALAAAPDKFETIEQKKKGLLRFGIKATNPREMLQKITFIVDEDYQLKEYHLHKADGTRIDAVLENKREDYTDRKWLVTQMKARIEEKNGMVTHAQVDLQYRTVTFEKKKHVLYRKIALRNKDDKGRYIKKNPKDVNPISFHFARYKIAAGPVRKPPVQPDAAEKDPYRGIWVP